ncbi:AAA family ATPase [Candidatus Parabeggiatoa sp. HSG14]|uniref:AAA family ATPase n=1 Tax=Candidatus Parabeggiatoa sp. HSG14 TaxID=3055593 RepID=UPI0025A86D46|nr:AAA family ATPase [Thiotrichales bacterium HSG14]
MSHKLPIGLSDFKEVREENYYYVDKSLFIQEVINRSSKVLLLPRPRRFGKTLNLSMLRYFLEKREESLAPLFKGLAIDQDTEIMQHQGQYPVIFLTFKSCKGSTIEDCLSQIRSLLIELYLEHQPQLYSQLNEYERKEYDKILTEGKQLIHWQSALSFLMRLFHQQTGKRVIVLLDEYDAPIHAGQEHGYYDEIILFMKILLGNALKDNSDLEKGVITGVLRIAKESIFSDLNNLDVLSLLDLEFQDCFGFTEVEVKQLMTNFSFAEADMLKTWYNGYLFGERIIYNPWSVLSFMSRKNGLPRPFWINTASESLLRDIITRTDPDFQEQIETLLEGRTITTELNENIVLRDLEYSESNIWSLLVFSGYLKPIKIIAQPILPLYELAIPNLEVYSFYQNTLKSWLHHQASGKRLQKLLHALIKTDFKTFGELLKEMVSTILSFHDTAGNKPERVYHVFVLGLLTHLMDRYLIRSNRESGYGRYDVLMIPHNKEEPGFIFEFKKVNKPEEKNHKTAMKSALDQIKEKQYAVELRNQGVKNIWGIGVVVSGKRVWVESFIHPVIY